MWMVQIESFQRVYEIQTQLVNVFIPFKIHTPPVGGISNICRRGSVDFGIGQCFSFYTIS